MNAWKQAGWIIALAAVAGVASAIFHPVKPAWYEVESAADLRWRISIQEARDLLEAGEVVWIDARSRAKYEEGHLPEAILLNPEEWGELMFSNQDALQAVLDRPVIVYCDGESCARSGEIGERLRELMGLDPVFVLQGDWRELQGAP